MLLEVTLPSLRVSCVCLHDLKRPPWGISGDSISSCPQLHFCDPDPRLGNRVSLRSWAQVEAGFSLAALKVESGG